MKRLTLLLVFGTAAFVLSSCTPARQTGMGYGPGKYRPYAVYPSSVYENAPGGWDVYRSSGGSTRLKYSE